MKVVITLFSCTSVINGTKYLMLDPEIECFQYNAFVWVGIVLGSLILVVAIFGFWFQSSRDDDISSQKQVAVTGRLSGEEVLHQRRLDAEIQVGVMHDDDVSTLGDPFFGNVTQEERTCADKTSTETVTQQYDFLKLLGKDKLLGNPDVKEEDEEEEEEEEILPMPKEAPGTLFANDDASFEDMFGEMK